MVLSSVAEKRLKMILSVLGLAMAVGLGFQNCSKTSSSDPVTTLNALTITPANISVTPGTSVVFSVIGGTSPYTMYVVSGGGSFSGLTYYSPSTVQTVTVQANDSAGNSTQTQVFVGTSPSGGVLQITPASTTVQPNGTDSIVVSGGTSPYTYSVLSGGGTMSGNLYIAPSTTQTVVIQVADSAGNIGTTTLTVTTAASGTPVACTGTYRIYVAGRWGTLSIGAQDSTGVFSTGYIDVDAFTGTIQGSCSVDQYNQDVISMTRTWNNGNNYQVYSGTMSKLITNSTTQLWTMSGTYLEYSSNQTNGISQPWTACSSGYCP